MKNITYLLVLLALGSLLVAGCKPKEANSSSSTPENTLDPNSDKPQQEADRSQIPDAFKHEGFAFYGMAQTKPSNWEINIEGQASKGTQEFVYVGEEDGGHKFKIVRTDGMSSLGTDVLLVKEDGIYIVETGGHEIEPALALPAKMETGKTWDTSYSLEQSGKKVDINMTNKITGQETVKTPAGEFEATVVTVTGTSSINGTESKVSGKAYYVKDRGPVRLELHTIAADGTEHSVTAQAVGEEAERTKE